MELMQNTKKAKTSEEWRLTTLGSHVSISSGESPSLFQFAGSGIPYFKVEQLGNSSKYLDSNSTPYHFERGKTVPKNSIIFAKRGAAIALNRFRILSEDSFMDTNLMALSTDEELDGEYLYYALSHLGLWGVADTTSVPQINNKHINPFEILLPGTDEQRAIATALSDVDALLDGLDRLIAKKRDIKLAAMQQLLTGKTRLPGFEGEWEVKSLGELGVFLKGSGIKKDDAQSGNIPCIRYGEIYTDHNDYVRLYRSHISRDVASAATRLKQGDLLFAGSGETKIEIGKCVAFLDDFEAYAGGDIVILRPEGVNPVFMGYRCNTADITAQKASKGQGDAVVHISSKALANIEISLPGVSEQDAIAEVLSDIDKEIEALEKRRTKTRDLKQAMMQELLTGRTRLI